MFAVSEFANIVRAGATALSGEALLCANLGLGVFRSERDLGEHGHDHLAGDGFAAISFESEHPFSADKFQFFLEHQAGNVFRAKGVVSFEAAIQGSSSTWSTSGLPWTRRHQGRRAAAAWF